MILGVEGRFSTIFKLKNGIVNAGKVAGSTGLVFFGGKSKRIGIDELVTVIINI